MNTLNAIIQMKKEDIAKMRKQDIIEAITTYTFYYQSNIDDKKKAENALIGQAEHERAAKRLLLGYLGESAKDENGYEQENLKHINLLELIGKVLVKASRY